MFGAISAAASGLRLAEAWLGATADNVANADSAAPPGRTFRAEVPIATANGLTGGVAVVGIGRRTDPPVVVPDPGNPLANARGLVTYPNVDLGVEMPNLLMAREFAAANVVVLARAEETYQSIIDLGWSSGATS